MCLLHWLHGPTQQRVGGCRGGMGARRLGLVAAAATAAAGLLELAALGAHVGLGAAAGHTGRAAEVLVSLAAVLGAAQQDAAGAGGVRQRQLVEGDALTAGLRGSSARTRISSRYFKAALGRPGHHPSNTGNRPEKGPVGTPSTRHTSKHIPADTEQVRQKCSHSVRGAPMSN